MVRERTFRPQHPRSGPPRSLISSVLLCPWACYRPVTSLRSNPLESPPLTPKDEAPCRPAGSPRTVVKTAKVIAFFIGLLPGPWGPPQQRRHSRESTACALITLMAAAR